MKTTIKKIILCLGLAFLLWPSLMLADTSVPQIKNPFDSLQVKIPGMERFQDAGITKDDEGRYMITNTWIGEYLAGLYKYAIGIIGILAAITFLIGAVVWITSAGNPSKIGEAKAWMASSLLGLALGLGSYLILASINSDLVFYKGLELSNVDKIEQNLPDFTDYQGGSSITSNAPVNIVTIEVDTANGKQKIQVDKSIAKLTIDSFAELKKMGFEVIAISHYRPGSKYCHGRGLAIDINPDQNYCIDCYKKKGNMVGSFYRPNGPGASKDYQSSKYSLTEKEINMMKGKGWCWGGDWKSSKDYMHFSFNCSESECAKMGAYDFGLSVKANHEKLGRTYP